MVEKTDASARQNHTYVKDIGSPYPSFPDKDDLKLLNQYTSSGDDDSYDDLTRPRKPGQPPVYYDDELLLGKKPILWQLRLSEAEILHIMRNGQRLSYQPGRLSDLFNRGQNWIDQSYQWFLSWFGIQNVAIRSVPNNQGKTPPPPPSTASGTGAGTTATITFTRTASTTKPSLNGGDDPNRPEDNHHGNKHSIPADKLDIDDEDGISPSLLQGLPTLPGGMGIFMSPMADEEFKYSAGVGGPQPSGNSNENVQGGIVFQENLVEAVESDDKDAQSHLVNDPEVYRVASSDVNPEELRDPEKGAIKYAPLLRLISHFNYHGVIISYQNIRALYDMYLTPAAIHCHHVALSRGVSYQEASRALDIFRNRQTELAENSSIFNELQRLHQIELLMERQSDLFSEVSAYELQANLLDTNILPIALHIIPRIMNQPVVLLVLGGGYLGGESVIFYPDLSSRHVNVENAVSQLLALKKPLFILPLENSMAVIQAGFSDISEPIDPELPQPPRQTARESLDGLLFQLRMLSILLPAVQWQSREQLSLMATVSASETQDFSPSRSGNMLSFPGAYGMATSPCSDSCTNAEETEAMENLMIMMAASVNQLKAADSLKPDDILIMPDKVLETLDILDHVHQLLPGFLQTVRVLDQQRLNPDAVNYAQQIQSLEDSLNTLVNDLGDRDIIYISQILLYLKNSPAYSNSEVDMANQVVDWVKIAQTLKDLSNLELAEEEKYREDDKGQITELERSKWGLEKYLIQITQRGTTVAGIARFNLQLERLITMMNQCKKSCHYFVKQMAQTLYAILSPILSTNIKKYHGVSVQLVDAIIELLAQTPVQTPAITKKPACFCASNNIESQKFITRYSAVFDTLDKYFTRLHTSNTDARDTVNQLLENAGHPEPVTELEWESICLRSGVLTPYPEDIKAFLSAYSSVIDALAKQHPHINHGNLSARKAMNDRLRQVGHLLPVTDLEWESICHEINRGTPTMVINKEQKQQLMALPFNDRKKALLHLLGESWDTQHILAVVSRSSEALVAGQLAITHEKLKETKDGTVLAQIDQTGTVATNAPDMLNQQLTLYHQQQELIHPNNMVFNAEGDLVFKGLKVYDPNKAAPEVTRAIPWPLRVSVMEYVLLRGKKDENDSTLKRVIQGKEATAVKTMFHPDVFHQKVKEERTRGIGN